MDSLILKPNCETFIHKASHTCITFRFTYNTAFWAVLNDYYLAGGNFSFENMPTIFAATVWICTIRSTKSSSTHGTARLLLWHFKFFNFIFDKVEQTSRNPFFLSCFNGERKKQQSKQSAYAKSGCLLIRKKKYFKSTQKFKIKMFKKISLYKLNFFCQSE